MSQLINFNGLDICVLHEAKCTVKKCTMAMTDVQALRERSSVCILAGPFSLGTARKVRATLCHVKFLLDQ